MKNLTMGAKKWLWLSLVGLIMAVIVLLLGVQWAQYQSTLEDQWRQRARLMVRSLTDQVGLVLLSEVSSGLQEITKVAVQGDILYAQVIISNEIAAESVADQGLKVVPLSREVPSQLEWTSLLHPDGTLYWSLVQPLSTPKQAYVSLGVSLASLKALQDGETTTALITLVVTLLLISGLSGLGWWWLKSGHNIKFDASTVKLMQQGPIHIGPLEIDDRRKTVSINDTPIQLSQREYDLLKLLASEPGKVFSPQEIKDAVWPDGVVLADDVKKYIYLLRQKIEPENGEPTIIVNVKGFGYRIGD